MPRIIQWMVGAIATIASIVAATAADRVIVVEDNDVVFARDEHYTQGIKLGYATDLAPAGFVAPSVDWLLDRLAPAGSVTRRVGELAFGQSIFTPHNLNAKRPPANDRPYAGWLYIGGSYARDSNGVRLDAIELLIGQIGPSSLAQSVHNDFHAAVRSVAAQGWETQVDHRYGFVASYERYERHRWTSDSGHIAELIPHLGLTVGNILTYPSIGLLARVGNRERCDYGPVAIRPALSGTAFDCLEKPIVGGSWSLFAGTQVRAVLRNMLVDGTSPTTSSAVHHRSLVADVLVGADWSPFDRWRIALTLTARSPEFSGQGRPDLFGALSISAAIF